MKDWKFTCPKCKESIEADTINECVLNVPHKPKCPCRYDMIVNDCDFEDRKLLNS